MDWTPFKVKEVEHISPNTAIIRFDLPEGKKRLGLTVASLVMVRVPNGEKDGKPDFAIR
jgi:NAD(P)H-flavin reductase